MFFLATGYEFSKVLFRPSNRKKKHMFKTGIGKGGLDKTFRSRLWGRGKSKKSRKKADISYGQPLIMVLNN